MGGIKISIGLSHKQFLKDLKTVTRRLKGMAKGMGRIGLRMGRSLARGLMRGAAAGAAGLAGVVGKSLGESGKFERFEFQFKSLLGSADAAKQRIDEMKDLDLEVDAELGDLINASRILTVFTNNMHAGTDAMRMMADAAAVTPNNIQDIAFWYGRAYSMIKSGRPFGEASMRLQEMGLMSGEARNEIERLSAGAGRMNNIGKILDVLNGEFLKFEGAALRNAKTWTGMMSIMRSATSQAFAAMGDAMMPLAKVWLQELIDKITELRNDGTLENWGTAIAGEFEKARDKLTLLLPKVKELASQIKTSIQAGTLDDTLADNIEAGFRIGFSKIVDLLRSHVPTFVDIGLELGAAMAEGIQEAMRKKYPKTAALYDVASYDPTEGKGSPDFKDLQNVARFEMSKASPRKIEKLGMGVNDPRQFSPGMNSAYTQALSDIDALAKSKTDVWGDVKKVYVVNNEKQGG